VHTQILQRRHNAKKEVDTSTESAKPEPSIAAAAAAAVTTTSVTTDKIETTKNYLKEKNASNENGRIATASK
jgi:hypothetical protein